MARKKKRRRSGKRRTAAQIRATRKMIAANRRRKKTRKNPSRKRRKTTSRRRKPTRRRSTKRRSYARKNPSRKRRRQKTKARRNPSRRRRRGGGKYKAKLGNFLPNLKELKDVGMQAVQIGGGYALTSAAILAIHGGAKQRITALASRVGPEDSIQRAAVWWTVETLTAFAVAGIAGVLMGKKIRDQVLLGGMLLPISGMAAKFIPAEAKQHIFMSGTPALGDFVSRRPTRALPRTQGRVPGAMLNDWVTQRRMA